MFKTLKQVFYCFNDNDFEIKVRELVLIGEFSSVTFSKSIDYILYENIFLNEIELSDYLS